MMLNAPYALKNSRLGWRWGALNASVAFIYLALESGLRRGLGSVLFISMTATRHHKCIESPTRL
jgi:hypothetical protein